MDIRNCHACLPVVALAMALSGCAASGHVPYVSRIDLLGVPASSAAAAAPSQRTVVITLDTRFVNVTSGETVRFIAGAQSFAWNFQIGPTISAFDLNQVAPPGVLHQRIVVYVATNPLYISNS